MTSIKLGISHLTREEVCGAAPQEEAII
jgi:hypothetical protein